MIHEGVLKLEGMSGKRVKYLLNDLCKKSKSYLEIGVWKGSTFIAAGYENKHLERFVAVDDWSEFGGPRQAFKDNLEVFKYVLPTPEIIERTFPFEFNERFDTIFFDGLHTDDGQYNGVLASLNLLNPGGTLVVDDYFWRPAMLATRKAIHDWALTNKVKNMTEYGYFESVWREERYWTGCEDAEGWWNGIVVIET